MASLIEGRFFDVTVLPKPIPPRPGMYEAPVFLKHKYYVVEAESAEEAAKVGAQFGEVLNIGFNTLRTVILKGER